MALRNSLPNSQARKTARGESTRLPIIRGGAVSLAVATLLSLALAAPSPARAASQASQATCSLVYFFGAHGVNEPRPGDPKWGTQVNAVWTELVKNLDPNAATGIVANYPESVVDLPKPEGPGLPKGPSPWTTLIDQILSLAPAVNTDAATLAGQMWNTYLACPDSSIVVAGYSQGAWAVDKALRILSADGPVGTAVLGNVKGVFLMGDPAWSYSTPKQLGIASTFNLGYGTEAAYLANGIPESHFRSACIGPDPICNFSLSSFEKNIGVHVYDYTSGNPSAATAGGDWLAAQLGGVS